jgi:CubicO group peptidase (beta-lactamase class C family)
MYEVQCIIYQEEAIDMRQSDRLVQTCITGLALILVLYGCMGGSAQVTTTTATLAPQAASEGRITPVPETSEMPESQGMDSGKLNEMLAEIERQHLTIDSVLVIRDNVIVLEKYWNGYQPDSTHELYSVTKSFVSALVGIAIDQNALKGVDQKVIDFFVGRSFANPDPRKSSMTLDHVLTMSSGLRWEEGDPEYQALYTSRDWVSNMLDRPMVAAPGTQFNYCSGCTHLLSAMIQQSTKMNSRDFAHKVLFQPLGITYYTWELNPQGAAIGGWGLKLAPRDMAKLGDLYLHQGTWNGQQIISRKWIETSVRSHIPSPSGGYGYQWWIYPDLNAYAALGRYGQMIFVQPETDLVVIFTATIDGDNHELELIRNYVLPSLKR